MAAKIIPAHDQSVTHVLALKCYPCLGPVPRGVRIMESALFKDLNCSRPMNLALSERGLVVRSGFPWSQCCCGLKIRAPAGCRFWPDLQGLDARSGYEPGGPLSPRGIASSIRAAVASGDSCFGTSNHVTRSWFRNH